LLREVHNDEADLPEAEIYVLDGGHFVLDTCADETAEHSESS
jgi:hypothetical protein